MSIFPYNGRNTVPLILILIGSTCIPMSDIVSRIGADRVVIVYIVVVQVAIVTIDIERTVGIDGVSGTHTTVHLKYNYRRLLSDIIQF